MSALHPHNLGAAERAWAVALILAWIALFGGGQLVDTRPDRCAISPRTVEIFEGAKACGAEVDRDPTVAGLIRVLLFYTLTNLAILSSMASMIGAFGRIARLGEHANDTPDPDPSNPYLSGAVRGFFVYLVTISGILALVNDPFNTPHPSDYLRLAGFLSLASFAVSYEPAIFSEISEAAYERILRKMQGRPNGGNGNGARGRGSSGGGAEDDPDRRT